MKQFGNPLLVGLLAGLVSGTLYASLATGSAVGLLLFYAAPLPAFIAGLGWGVSSAAATLASGMLLSLGLLGPLAGFTYVAAVAAPALIITHYAFLFREVSGDADDPSGSEVIVEWYPVGNLMLIMALIAGTLAAISVVVLGPSYADYVSTIDREIAAIVKQGTEAGIFKPMSAEDLDRYKAMIIAILPASTAIIWLLFALINLWAAGHIVRMSGQLRRPWPDISAFRLPSYVPALVLLMLVLSLLFGGLPDLLLSGYAAALAAACLALGLAIVHHISRGHPLRGLFLFATYAGVFLIGWGAPLLILAGLLDALLDFRRSSGKTNT